MLRTADVAIDGDRIAAVGTVTEPARRIMGAASAGLADPGSRTPVDQHNARLPAARAGRQPGGASQ